MNKKMWEEPRIELHQFTVNEYVSVCMDIACTEGGIFHTRCRNFNNQVIRGDKDTGFYVIELRNGNDVSNGGTYLSYSLDFNNTNKIYYIPTDQEIYWNNKYRGITYHHHGTAVSQDESRPNHS